MQIGNLLVLKDFSLLAEENDEKLPKQENDEIHQKQNSSQNVECFSRNQFPEEKRWKHKKKHNIKFIIKF